MSELFADLIAASRRIEAKLDRLIAALAEDGQDGDQGSDLEGRSLPADRDPNEPL